MEHAGTMVPKVGLEPTRGGTSLRPERSASSNSATSAGVGSSQTHPPSIGLARLPRQVSRELWVTLCTLRTAQPTPASAKSLAASSGEGPGDTTRMKTITTRATVARDGTLTIRLPPDIRPGEHRVVLVIDEHPEAKPEPRSPDMPVLHVGTWPAQLSLRRC